ncbi:MAG: translation initiation factor IF-2 [Bacteroidetes bacterium]|nr:translation initiation factor IF-2 [Bacteroidota bacterium]MCL5034001.1 translation initiation factor IF-2 [Bacteroidota bacterium]
MAETATKKKLVTKVASEFQVSADQIVDFLKSKGHDKVKRTSSVDEHMYAELSAHFKKELDQVGKRQKIKEQLSEKQEEKVVVKKLVDTVTVEKQPVVESKLETPPVSGIVGHGEGTSRKETEAPVAETQVAGGEIETAEHAEITTPTEEQPEIGVGPTTIEAHEASVPLQEMPAAREPDLKPVEARAGGEAAKTEIPAAQPEIKEEKITAPKTAETVAKTAVQEPPPKEEKGLKIRGRIDLQTGQRITEEEMRLRKELEEAQKKTKEAAAQLETETQAHKKKKKKRKKIREESTTPETPAVAPVVSDEDLKKRKKKKGKHPDVDQAEVELAFQRTMANLEDGGESDRAALRKKKRKEKFEAQQREIEKQESEKRKLKLTEFVSVGELAKLMSVDVAEVISKCISFGLMVSINQRLDLETITLLADDFGYEVELQEEYTDEVLEDKPDPLETLKPRPPVVTIMGHVDHGKTSLLDFIRQANVVAGEAGGITQHIGAYQVKLPNRKQITFLDTPGHEAFTAMRARGAQATDIVILVVAADDNVMPQTIEAINHARAANVPMIVAINKIDRPEANPDRIRKQLADQGVLLEEWGGKTQSVEISAKKGTNVDLLLEKVLLEAEILDLRTNPDRLARGVVIESTLDRGRGAVATVLVQKGTLTVGDSFVAGTSSGKVRAMTDERGNRIEAASPAMPVQVIGFDELPFAGDMIVSVANEKMARDISNRRKIIKREQDMRGTRHHVTLEELSKEIKEGMVKQLSIVVKGDVDGSVEALSDSLAKLSNDEVRVQVIHKGVGAISESDVLLAAASNAIILGFHVRPSSAARKLAESESVDIKLYSIIYDAIESVRKGLEGLLSPEIREEVVGSLDVRQIFKVPKFGTVAGCYVTSGRIQRSNRVRLVRDGIVVFEGSIASLKRFKDDVREVEDGYECGVSLENFNDLKSGDTIEAFTIVETQRTLA